MEAIQLDLFHPLVKPTEKVELCRNWKTATKNDCGVYTLDTHHYPAKAGKNILQLHVALAFPYIRIECSIDVAGDYGCHSPITDDSKAYNVYEDPYQLAGEVTDWLDKKVSADGNLTAKSKAEFIKLIPTIVDNFFNDITKEKQN